MSCIFPPCPAWILRRVLLEAGRAGVPLVATDYAAAAELVPAANLVSVHITP